MTTKIVYPDWLTGLHGVHRHRAELEFLLRLIALHHNEGGSLPKLSLAMGFHRTRLNIFIREGRIPAEVAKAVPNLAPSLVRNGITARKLAEFVG